MPFASHVSGGGFTASLLGDVTPEYGDEFVPRAPGGEPLTHGHRMTYREPRSWMKRNASMLGRWPCGLTIEWVRQDLGTLPRCFQQNRSRCETG